MVLTENIKNNYGWTDIQKTILDKFLNRSSQKNLAFLNVKITIKNRKMHKIKYCKLKCDNYVSEGTNNDTCTWS